MEWFKHDSSATQDAKIKKLLMRHGAIGYAVYFHCLELITSDIGANNLTFQLEHDSEIIADNLRIVGTAGKSGQLIVEEIMHTIVDLDLLQQNNGFIYGLKILKRLDSSMTSNPTMRNMITKAKEKHKMIENHHDETAKSHDTIMIPSCKNRIEEKEENRKKRDRRTKTQFENKPITQTIHDDLVKTYGEKIVRSYYERIEDYELSHTKNYKDYSATARAWIRKDKEQGKGPTPLPPPPQECPACGSRVTVSGCNTCTLEKNQWGKVDYEPFREYARKRGHEC